MSLLNLNDDPWEVTMRYFSPQTLARFERTCKRFRKLAVQKGWEILFLKYFGKFHYEKSVLSAKRQFSLCATLEKNLEHGFFVETKIFSEIIGQKFLGKTTQGILYGIPKKIPPKLFKIYDQIRHQFLQFKVDENWNEIDFIMPVGDFILALVQSKNNRVYFWNTKTKEIHPFENIKFYASTIDNQILKKPNCGLLLDGSLLYMNNENQLTISNFEKEINFQEKADGQKKNLEQYQQMDENHLFVISRSPHRVNSPISTGHFLQKNCQGEWEEKRKLDLYKNSLCFLPSKQIICIEDSKELVKIDQALNEVFRIPFNAGKILSNLVPLKDGRLTCVVEKGLCLIDLPNEVSQEDIQTIPWNDFGPECEKIGLGYPQEQAPVYTGYDETYEISAHPSGKKLFIFNYFLKPKVPFLYKEFNKLFSFVSLDIESMRCRPIRTGSGSLERCETALPGKFFVRKLDYLNLSKTVYDFLPSEENILSAQRPNFPFLNVFAFVTQENQVKFESWCAWFSKIIPGLHKKKLKTLDSLRVFLEEKFKLDQELFEKVYLQSRMNEYHSLFIPGNNKFRFELLPQKFQQIYIQKIEVVLRPYASNPFQDFGICALTMHPDILKAEIKGISLKKAYEEAHQAASKEIADLMGSEYALPPATTKEIYLERKTRQEILQDLSDHKKVFILDYLSLWGIDNVKDQLGFSLSDLEISKLMLSFEDFSEIKLSSNLICSLENFKQGVLKSEKNVVKIADYLDDIEVLIGQDVSQEKQEKFYYALNELRVCFLREKFNKENFEEKINKILILEKERQKEIIQRFLISKNPLLSTP